jgi:DNA-binding LytR/AlgR family response regulator
VTVDPDGLLQALDAVQHQQIPERFTVLAKGRLRVLAWADVTHLRTENRLLFVHTSEGRFVLDRSLDELQALLAPRFQRTHRSAMVALAAVKELETEPGGFGELVMQDGARVPVSRDRMAEVRRSLGER